MSDKINKVTIIKMGFLASLWSNLLNIVTLLLAFYLNYKFIGGNNWVDCIIFLSFLVYVLNCNDKHIHKFKTPEEAIEFLKGEENDDK